MCLVSAYYRAQGEGGGAETTAGYRGYKKRLKTFRVRTNVGFWGPPNL